MGLATLTNNILVDSGILTDNVPTSAFPSQTGNDGKYLTTDGSALSWATVSGGGGMEIGGSITSATAGSVLFAGTSGVLAQNNSNLFWDDTNNRLGIGTNTPSSDITISKNQNAATLISVSNTTSGIASRAGISTVSNLGQISFSKTSSTFGTVGLINANDAYIYNTGGGNINIINDVSGKIIFAAGGNSTAQMTLTAAGRLLLGTTTESTYILDVNGSVKFGTSGSGTGMYWDNTNNRLGIGISSPLYRLDVNGTSRFSGDMTISGGTQDYIFSKRGNTILTLQCQTTGTEFRTEIYSKDGDGTKDIGIVFFAKGIPTNLTNNEQFRIAYRPGTQSYTIGTNKGGTGSDRDIRIGNTTDPTDLVIKATTGNILINTTTDAGYRLDVNGTARVTGLITASAGIQYTRLNPVTTTTASTATLTPDISLGDTFTITAQAAGLSVANPTGTPVNGQKMTIRIKDNGTARAITWSGTQFRASPDLTLPSSTTAGKTIYLGFLYNSTDTKWDLVSKIDNF